VSPHVTIAICTHDRCAILGRAVEGALAEAGRADAEVLVVDNASTDQTAGMLAALRRQAPALRVAVEPELGLSAARNRGLAEARGQVIAYLDDDAVPRPGWLAALRAPYAAPRIASVGGRVLLRFPSPPPSWLTPAFHGALSAFDLGDRPLRLRGRSGLPFPTGANISFRVADARRLGGFSPLVGPRGRRPLVHDETDLCARIDRAGGEIHYAPAAIVDHWVLPERLAPGWFLRRHWESGQSAAIYALRNRSLLRSLWGLRWYGPYAAIRRYLPKEPIDSRRLLAECQRREALGYLVGLARGLPRLRALRGDAEARTA
jgi:glycosyltransferase involved in cell wall biosynthesis